MSFGQFPLEINPNIFSQISTPSRFGEGSFGLIELHFKDFMAK